MQSGAYKHQIVIERRETTIDAIGNTVRRWEVHKHDYAYVNGISGREYWEAQAVNKENTVDFTLRWKPYIDELNTIDYRVKFKGEYYNIETIDNIRFANQTVKLRCISSNGKDNG